MPQLLKTKWEFRVGGTSAQPPTQWVMVSFQEVKRSERGVNHPPHLARKLKTELGYISTALWAFKTYYRVKFAFFLHQVFINFD